MQEILRLTRDTGRLPINRARCALARTRRARLMAEPDQRGSDAARTRQNRGHEGPPFAQFVKRSSAMASGVSNRLRIAPQQDAGLARAAQTHGNHLPRYPFNRRLQPAARVQVLRDQKPLAGSFDTDLGCRMDRAHSSHRVPSCAPLHPIGSPRGTVLNYQARPTGRRNKGIQG